MATFLLIILVWKGCFSSAGLQGRVRIKGFVSVSAIRFALDVKGIV